MKKNLLCFAANLGVGARAVAAVQLEVLFQHVLALQIEAQRRAARRVKDDRFRRFACASCCNRLTGTHSKLVSTGTTNG